MKAGFGAQVETHPAVVRRLFDLACDQTVLGERLIQALSHQCVVDQRDVIGRHTLVDERVETVEAAKASLAEGTALGRIRVDVVEVLEVGRIFRGLVVQRQGMLRGGQRLGTEAGQQQGAGLQAKALQ
ncbi:hypothetical protein D9M71_673450 [compost metagenome]